MAGIGRNVSILSFRMKVSLKVRNILRLILPVIIKICLELQRKDPSLWMNPEQMIYPMCLWRRITFLLLNTLKRR
jgi:hypothetical protein